MKLSYVPLFILLIFYQVSLTAGPARFEISISNHRFSPANTTVPANTRIQLIIRNEDRTVEAINSRLLSNKVIIKGNSSATIDIGPLNPGVYYLFGEMHRGTQARILVR